MVVMAPSADAGVLRKVTGQREEREEEEERKLRADAGRRPVVISPDYDVEFRRQIVVLSSFRIWPSGQGNARCALLRPIYLDWGLLSLRPRVLKAEGNDTSEPSRCDDVAFIGCRKMQLLPSCNLFADVADMVSWA